MKNREVCQAAITAAVLARMEGGDARAGRLAAMPIVADLDVDGLREDVAGLCSLVASVVVELGRTNGQRPDVIIQRRFLRMEGASPPLEGGSPPLEGGSPPSD